MGRRYANVVAIIGSLSISLASSASVRAQPPGSHGFNQARGIPRHGPQIKTPRERWLALPPEDRQVFRRNAERWMQMNPEERKTMRERDRVYRERIKHEVDSVLRDSGLRLEGEKRELFEQRYIQERRRMERALHQEIEAKRNEQLPALNERLKKEFQEPSSPGTSTSSPATSIAPKK